jgi:hypothetical protein
MYIISDKKWKNLPGEADCRIRSIVFTLNEKVDKVHMCIHIASLFERKHFPF